MQYSLEIFNIVFGEYSTRLSVIDDARVQNLSIQEYIHSVLKEAFMVNLITGDFQSYYELLCTLMNVNPVKIDKRKL